MKRVLVFIFAFGLITGALASTAFGYNVAFNKPVIAATPALFGMPGPAYAGWDIPAPPIAAFSSVTDGIFLDEGHQWNHDTVWWDDSYSLVLIDIDLEGDFLVNRLVVQADNNDKYIFNLADNFVNQMTVSIPTVPGWGMMTREIVLPTPVLIDYIRFSHYPGGDGDSLYSVSEIQAFGTPVPEPATMLLLGSGLVGLAGLRRKWGKN